MANKITLEITVDDKGSPVIKQFGQNAEGAFKQTENAAKSQMGTLDQLKNNWVTASATIVAAWMAVNKAVEYMDLGAKALQVESSFKIMAESSNVNADQMVANMKRVTRETIDDADLMQKAVKLMTMGYDPAQIERFSNVVVTSSQIAGQTVDETYSALADSIATKMPKALVRLGAVTREQMKIVNAAVAAGADEMTLYELAMANLELKQLMLKGTQDEETIAMQRFHAEMKEGKETVGKYTIEGVQLLWSGLKKLGGAAYDVAAGFAAIRAGKLEAEAQRAKEAFDKYFESAAGEAKQKLLTNMTNTQYLADQAFQKSADMRTKARLMMGFEDDEESDRLKKSTAEELAAGKARVAAQMETMAAIAAKAKADAEAAKAAEALAKAEEKVQQDIIKTLADRKQYEGSYYAWKSAEVEAGLQEAIKAGVSEESIAKLRKEKLINVNLEIYKEYKKSIAAWDEDTHKKQKAMADEEEKATEATLQAYATVYAGIKIRSEDLYDVQVELIEKQKEAFIKNKVDEVTAEAWATEQKKLKWIEYAENSDDVMMGIEAGYKRMQNEQTKWGKVGADTFKSMCSSMSSTFSNVFEDAYKGKLKSLGDYTTAIWDGIRKAFFDAIAKMATDKIILYFTTEWASTGANVIGVLAKILNLGDWSSDSTSEITSDVPLTYYRGGKVPAYAEGGYVDGRANFSGNHPGNDTVPAWLSPGEWVVPRTGVNPETEKILKYISLFGAVPRYADGGLVVTSEPNKGYWGFSDLFSVFTGGVSDVVQGNPWGSGQYGMIGSIFGDKWGRTVGSLIDPLGSTITEAEAAHNFYEWLDAVADPTHSVNWSLEEMGKWLPENVRALAPQIATLIGTAIHPVGGTAAGYGIGAHIAGQSPMQAQIGAGTAAAASYVSTAVSKYIAGETGSAVAGKVAGTLSAKLVRMGIDATTAAYMTDKLISGNVKASYKGQTGVQEILNTLNDFMASGQNKTFSALNGLDFVPRDNFRINAHEGEAVLNKKDARAWRGGGDSAELVAEIKELRAEIKAGNYAIAKNTGKMAKILDRFDNDGIPAERAI